MKDHYIAIPVVEFYLCLFGIFVGGFLWGYVIHKVKNKQSAKDEEIRRLRAELEKKNKDAGNTSATGV